MSRLKYTLINARVNLIFYIALLILTLFSRKILLQFLGNDLVGLNATIQNILGIMNLAELGIWPATAYALYKYIYNDDKEKIKEIITLFGHFYRTVGFVILGAGLITALFLPLIFKNSGVDFFFILASFFTFLFSVLLGYFFNYKQILLVADQKNFILITISSTIQIVKTLIQIGFLYLMEGNYFIWLLLECIFAIINTIYLNIYVNKYYPWLRIEKFNKQLLSEHKPIIMNIKRLISHKFASVSISQTDNILIYSFVGLAQVTSFTNYTLLINKAISFFNSFLNSGTSSIGNLIASKEDQKIKNVFYEFLALRYLMAGVVVICLFYLMNPFISLWLGSQYLLNNTIVILILFNTYISMTRNSVDSFIDGYGLYGHVWAPWSEAILNLIISGIFGFKYGIAGVLFGTSISSILIVCLWRPYYLFRSGFKKNGLLNYWKTVIRNILVLLFITWIMNFLTFYKNDLIISYKIWILHAVSVFIISFLVHGVILYPLSPGLRSLTVRLYNNFETKFKKIKC